MQLLKYQITHQERKKIFALQRELKLDKERLYDLMSDWCNVVSLKADNCSSSQAKIIVKNLTAMKNKERPGFITAKQKRALNAMRKELKWTEGQFNKFILHTVAKDDMGELTVGEASKVIVGIKNYKKI